MNRIRNLIWGRGRPSRRGERDAQKPSRTELPLTNVMSKRAIITSLRIYWTFVTDCNEY